MGAALAIENLAVFEKTRRRPWPSSKAAKKNGEKPEDVQKTKGIERFSRCGLFSRWGRRLGAHKDA
jgi:hypothetical protein